MPVQTCGAYAGNKPLDLMEMTAFFKQNLSAK